MTPSTIGVLEGCVMALPGANSANACIADITALSASLSSALPPLLLSGKCLTFCPVRMEPGVWSKNLVSSQGFVIGKSQLHARQKLNFR
ncbi:MAG: hypothetical protein DMG40_16125 [Acidobacteria bacterium]|nr:MAG: hypothetical protein DMG40_16125 [Acidobacteriota bacterium]